MQHSKEIGDDSLLAGDEPYGYYLFDEAKRAIKSASSLILSQCTDHSILSQCMRYDIYSHSEWGQQQFRYNAKQDTVQVLAMDAGGNVTSMKLYQMDGYALGPLTKSQTPHETVFYHYDEGGAMTHSDHHTQHQPGKATVRYEKNIVIAQNPPPHPLESSWDNN